MEYIYVVLTLFQLCSLYNPIESRRLDDYWSLNDRSFNLSLTTKIYDPKGRSKDNYGRSVALAGNYALVGSPEYDEDDDQDDSGRVLLYEFNAGAWEIIRYMSDGIPGDYFGWCLDFHRSYTAVVGAWRDSTYGDFSGAIYLYDIETDKKKKQGNGTRLYASDPKASAYFGYSVALGDYSGQEPQLVVGAYGSNYRGEAYIFRRDYSGNWYELTRLAPTDGSMQDRFGWSVDIYMNHVAVGAPLHKNNGAVYIYWFTDGSWILGQKITQSFASNTDDDVVYDFFGLSVATGDGVVVIGAPGNSIMGTEAGAIYVYVDSSYVHDNYPTIEEMKYSGRKLSDTINNVLYPFASSSSSSTKALTSDQHQGLQRAQRKLDNMDEYTFLQVLAAPDSIAYSRFGWFVDYDGFRRRVIAGTDTTKLKTSGSATLYRFGTDKYFNLEYHFTPRDESGNIMYGISCAVNDDMVIVGAARGTGRAMYSGSAYIYMAQS